MDPNACLAELAEALERYDYESAQARLDDLLNWMVMGGFQPSDISTKLDEIISKLSVPTKLSMLRKMVDGALLDTL